MSKFHLEFFKYTKQSMKLFISYATEDLESFRISEIVQFLEEQKDIEKVWYWDRDSKDFPSIITYMESGITSCDVFLAISTQASYNSAPVNQEIDLAIYSNKKIIPVFENIDDVRPLLRPKTGVKFTSTNFQDFLENLLFILTNKRKDIPQDDSIISIGKKKILKQMKMLEIRLETDDISLEERKKIKDKIRQLNKKLRKITYISNKLNKLEKRIELEDLSLEEENKVVDEINQLEKELEEILADNQNEISQENLKVSEEEIKIMQQLDKLYGLELIGGMSKEEEYKIKKEIEYLEKKFMGLQK